MEPFDAPDYGQLAYGFSRWLSDLIVDIKPRVLVIELPPSGLKGHASIVLNGLFWSANQTAFAHEIGRRSIDPLSLKRWAVGKTAASKDDMTRAARTLGYEPINHDHGDACCLHAWASVATAEEAAA
jgi:hypothetical protein